MPIAHLDRTVFRLSGDTARAWLDGLITNSFTGPITFAALLTPQGKIIADFFIRFDGEDLLLDTPDKFAGDLKKRLMMYKLREKITITQEDLSVYAAWDGKGDAATLDPRHGALGHRILAPSIETTASAQDYNAHRLALGIPDSAHDFDSVKTFPANANMDILNGVDFKKGCFVGQEVVSRMHRKTQVRKRMCGFECGQALETGTALMQGEVNVGEVLSQQGGRGMAMIRLDRLSDGDVLAGGHKVKVMEVTHGA